MKTTPLVTKLAKLAEERGLSYPLGRAYYAVNRTYNGGLGRYFEPSYFDPNNGLPADFDVRLNAQITCMRTMRADTAERWINHVRKGGSLKSMSRTAREESERRRTEHLRHVQRRRSAGDQRD